MLIKLLSIMVMAAVVACGTDGRDDADDEGVGGTGGGDEGEGGSSGVPGELDEPCTEELSACSVNESCHLFVSCIGTETEQCSGSTVPKSGLPIGSLCMSYLWSANNDGCRADQPLGYVLYMDALVCAELARADEADSPLSPRPSK